jgi:hypothetical protein
MHGYLGETEMKSSDGTPYEGFGHTEWAMKFIESYGQIDGGHHKQWVLDQVARILHGTPIELSLAKWDTGIEEYRYSTGEPSQAYLDWVKEMRGECKDGEYEYNYDEGTAP